MHVSSDSIVPIQALTEMPSQVIASLGLTDRKALFAALRVLSVGSSHGPIDQAELQNCHKVVSDIKSKLEHPVSESTKFGCFSSILKWISGLFGPSAKKIQVQAQKITKRYHDEQQEMASLQEAITQLNKKKNTLTQRSKTILESDSVEQREIDRSILSIGTTIREKQERLLSLKEKYAPSPAFIASQQMNKNIETMRSVDDKKVQEEFPRDFSRFLNYFSVRVRSSQNDSETQCVAFTPDRLLEVEREVDDLGNKIVELEKKVSDETVSVIESDIQTLRSQQETKKLEAANLRKEHAFATLRALAPSPEDLAEVNRRIESIEHPPEGQLPLSLSDALDAALSKNRETLPKNIQYLFVAGAQTVQSAYLEIFQNICSTVKVPQGVGLFVKNAEERRIMVELTQNPSGALEKISFVQEMTFPIDSMNVKEGDARTLLLVPTRHTIIVHVEGEKRTMEDSVQITGEPQVVADTPTSRALASNIRTAFQKGFSQTGQI